MAANDALTPHDGTESSSSREGSVSLAHSSGREGSVSLPYAWAGPRTVTVHRAAGGFGFTLRHFIVYPPESAVQQLQEQEDSCNQGDGSQQKRSKLSALDPMDTIFVKHVKESGPAQDGGLNKGDRIISVNGESVTGKSYSQVIALIQSSESTLKLLVVPRDEDILQMAYESSAYNQGREPYRGSASEIPHPPQAPEVPHSPQAPSLRSHEGVQPASSPLSHVHRPTRYKSEIKLVPEDLGPGGGVSQKSSLFDPRIPRQRLSTSSVGSLSSGSSYSGPQPANPTQDVVAMDTSESDPMLMLHPAGEGASCAVMATDFPVQRTMAPSLSHRAPPSGVSDLPSAAAANPSMDTSPAVGASATAYANQPPPTVPARSSSRNVTSFLNVQGSSGRSHHDLDMRRFSPHRSHAARTESQEDLMDTSEGPLGPPSPVSSASLSSTHSAMFPVQPPAVEKLLMTSHESSRARRPSRETSTQSEHSPHMTPPSHHHSRLTHPYHSSVTSSAQSHSHSGTPERKFSGSGHRVMSTTRLPPGASTTITLSTSSMPPTSASRDTPPPAVSMAAQQHWTSESNVHSGDWSRDPASHRSTHGASPYGSRGAPSGQGKLSASEQSLLSKSPASTAGSDSYGLTVSLHMGRGGAAGHKNASHGDIERLGPHGDDSRPPINMVTERLKKYESSDSVVMGDGSSGYMRRQRMPQRVGYDSVRSRAAEFEQRAERRPSRDAMATGGGSTGGSLSSLSQAVPPSDFNKVPQTPPATINFYFREKMAASGNGTGPAHSSMANLEPSPELTLSNPDGFRVRVSSEPPEVRGRERGPLANISITYGGDQGSAQHHQSAISSRKAAFMAAVSTQPEGKGHHGSPKGPSGSTATMGGSTGTIAGVTLRERSRSEDREGRLMRRTSYLMATGRQNTVGGATTTSQMDVSQLVIPPRPSLAGSGAVAMVTDCRPPVAKPDSLALSPHYLEVTPEVNESSGTPDSRSPSTPLTPTSPRLPETITDNITTPVKSSSNIKKLKSLFGERTPRILEAITDRKNVFDVPSAASGVVHEGTLICKVAVTDGKRASDRSWKPAYAQLRTHSLYLFRDRNNVSANSLEDQPISIRSSIVDIAYDYTKKKHVFRLTTSNGSEFLFQAEDHESMLQWIRAIQGQSNPDQEQKERVAGIDVVVSSSVPRQETTASAPFVVSKTSPLTAPKSKKTSTRNLRSKSPSAHSPASKPKKQLLDKSEPMDPSASKPKDSKTWKDRMAKTFKRYGSSSSAPADIPEGPSDTITGTFGVPLDLVPSSSFSENVPLIVEVCTKIVEERGLENQGIYRVPGNTGAVNQLQEEFNKAADIDSLDMENEKWLDVNVVSSLLKLFFRKLPEPLITEDLYQLVIAANRTSNQVKRMLKIKKLLHDLPEHNFETFHFMAEHLNRVAEKGDINKMDGRNLAIVFGPTLIRTSYDNMITMVTDMSDQCRIVESIISNCNWFFSSWSEDVHVPLDEHTDTVPVSGMNQELIVKAENLGMSERGRDVSVKDLMSSVLHAANKKIRKVKPKGESVDIEADSESSSFNERNIDREIELRKGTTTVQQLSQHTNSGAISKTSSSSLSLEHTSTATSLSVSVTDSKATSPSWDQHRSKESFGATSSSSLSSKQPVKSNLLSSSSSPPPSSGSSESHPSSPPLHKTSSDEPDTSFPIKRYPAYPKAEYSSPQTDNSKPMLFKKYYHGGSSGSVGGGVGSTDTMRSQSDWRRGDNDEVKKTQASSLTPQTRQHLRRMEAERQALQRRQEEKLRDQAKHAQAKKKIEMELQKTRREMEGPDQLDELIARGGALGSGGGDNVSGKISECKQKYSDFINSSLDSRSVTSDYSTMSSSNLPSATFGGQQDASSGDSAPVRVSSSVPRELCYSSSSQDKMPFPTTSVPRRDSASRTDTGKQPHPTTSTPASSAPKQRDLSNTSRGGGGVSSRATRSSQSSRDDLEIQKNRAPQRGKTVDGGDTGDPLKDRHSLVAHGDASGDRLKERHLAGHGDMGHKTGQRKGSLDSLLDTMYDHDIAHIDSDVEDSSAKRDEGLLESIAHARPQFQLLGNEKAAVKSKVLSPQSSRSSGKSLGGEMTRHKSEGDTERPFRDPSLHKCSSSSASSSQKEPKIVGIASRFERKDSSSSPVDKSLPCYNSDSRLVSGINSGSKAHYGLGTASKEHRKSEYNNSSDNKENVTIPLTKNKTDHAQTKQEETAKKQYANALRKSTEKIFGSRENLRGENQSSPAEVPQTRPRQSQQARDRKNKRRRFTVGGPGDLEHYEALLLATEQSQQQRASLQSGHSEDEDPRSSAYDRLQPKGPAVSEGEQQVTDVQSWCLQQQRLRHAGSSPALFDPSATANGSGGEGEEPPLKRKGSVKTGEGGRTSASGHRTPSRSGSSRSQSTKSNSSSCHSSTPSPSSPGPGSARGITAPLGFVSTV